MKRKHVCDLTDRNTESAQKCHAKIEKTVTVIFPILKEPNEIMVN
jgi:hypothetical protein